MLSILSGILCMIIGFGLLLFGIAVLIFGFLFSIARPIKKIASSKVNGLGAAAVTGGATYFAYKKGLKDGQKLN